MNTPRKIRTLLALAVLPCVLVAFHPEMSLADWTQTNGPRGGSIRSLLAVPNGAGGTSLHAGSKYVWRTDDQGASWTQHRNGLTDPTPFALLAVPNGSGGNDILAGTANGIFRSADNGVSWIASSSGVPANLSIYALASGPDGSGGTNLYAGTYLGQAFRSTDNGASWTAISSGLPVGQANVNALVTTPSGTVLAGTMNGIYRSTNFGASWTRVFTFYGFSFEKHGTALYAGTANGVYTSTNDGATWTAINSGMGFSWIYTMAAIPNGSGVTLFATAGGVLRSTDNGATWTPVNNGLTSSGIIQALTTTPNASGGTDLYAGTSRGIFRLSNNGDTWTNVSFVYSNVRGLAVTQDGAILAGADPFISRSSDAGATWTDTNAPMMAHDFTVSPNGNIFACSFADGVFKSTDGGVTWTDSNINLPELEVNAVAAVPNGAGGTNILAGTYSGIFISTNDGGSWQLREVNSMPFDFTVIPDGSGGHKIFGGGEAGVWSSTDYGATWAVLGLGATARSLAATNNGASLFAGGESFGVYRSTDGGASWTLVNNGLTDPRINTLLSPDGTNLLAAGAGGVFLSTDQGDHWTSVGTGLTAGVLSLTMSADGTDLLAGTTEFGVWTRPLSELIITGVNAEIVPRTMSLRSYPNPFNPNTTIQFSLLETGRVRLGIYDVAGRLVRTLVDGVRNAGDQRVFWDGRDDRGALVGSGVYVYQLEAGNKSLTRKMSLLR